MAPATLYGNTGTVWIEWTGTTSTTNATYDVWPLWNQTGTTSAATTMTTWLSWNTGFQPVEMSPEEREARDAAAAERRRLADEAKVRARTLLRDVLDETQRTELERDGHFHVQTKDGERVYRLKPGSAPVRIKGEDGSRWSYCIHPRESYPADDTVAALKLMIEAEEDRFLEIANATHLGRIPEPVAA